MNTSAHYTRIWLGAFFCLATASSHAAILAVDLTTNNSGTINDGSGSACRAGCTAPNQFRIFSTPPLGGVLIGAYN
ncbi:MAG: hypothetical protein ABL877_12980 [Thiobacillus sp.]